MAETASARVSLLVVAKMWRYKYRKKLPKVITHEAYLLKPSCPEPNF